MVQSTARFRAVHMKEQQFDTEFFIEEVKNSPDIWDLQCDDYNKSDLKLIDFNTRNSISGISYVLKTKH